MYIFRTFCLRYNDWKHWGPFVGPNCYEWISYNLKNNSGLRYANFGYEIENVIRYVKNFFFLFFYAHYAPLLLSMVLTRPIEGTLILYTTAGDYT